MRGVDLFEETWQCQSCGSPGMGDSCRKCGAANAVAGLRHASFTLRAQCAHCGGPLPLLGPLREVPCEACGKTTPITANEWGRILMFASRCVSSMNIGRHEIASGFAPHAKPACASCATPMPLDALAIGTDTSAKCACGEALVTYPAPAWLRDELPALVQLYGADREASTTPATRAHVEPVVMACPKCGGSLDIAADAQRTTKCTFCSASIYLPDDLWRALHPVKTVRAWTLAFEGGTLVNKQTLADRVQEAQKVADDAARHQREITEAAEAAARERVETKRANRTMLIVAVVLFVVSVGAVAFCSSR
jgi:hypothetical protein